MKYLIFLSLFFLPCFAADAEIYPAIAHRETKYKAVAPLLIDTTGGVVIPNGETVAIYRIRLNGADPAAYVRLVWDHGGGSEKIFASSRGDIDVTIDVTDTYYQVTGNGSKSIKIIIDNANGATSPVIGGSWEAIKVL